MSSGARIVAGSVVSLWRYPIKSMIGEELNVAEVTERGLVGDRAFALVDLSDGKLASAKNPRKWAKLFDFRAAYVQPPRSDGGLPPVRITLPDGTMISSGQGDLDEIISNVLGRAVTLAATPPAVPTLEEYSPDLDNVEEQGTVAEVPVASAAPAGTFFDYAVVHVLTTATLDRFRELYPAGRFEVRRFRPNIVVAPASGERGFVENAWIGRTLSIGGEVRLHVIDPCPRCVMTTLPQGDLPKDPGILRTVTRHNRATSATYAPGQIFPAVAGVYASVVRGGTIRRGDPVRLD